MTVKYCMLCERKVSAEWQIGVGTLILVVITAGLWLLAILFYEERCPICKATEFKENEYQAKQRSRRGQKVGYWLGRKLRAVFRH